MSFQVNLSFSSSPSNPSVASIGFPRCKYVHQATTPCGSAEAVDHGCNCRNRPAASPRHWTAATSDPWPLLLPAGQPLLPPPLHAMANVAHPTEVAAWLAYQLAAVAATLASRRHHVCLPAALAAATLADTGGAPASW